MAFKATAADLAERDRGRRTYAHNEFGIESKQFGPDSVEVTTHHTTEIGCDFIEAPRANEPIKHPN